MRSGLWSIEVRYAAERWGAHIFAHLRDFVVGDTRGYRKKKKASNNGLGLTLEDFNTIFLRRGSAISGLWSDMVDVVDVPIHKQEKKSNEKIDWGQYPGKKGEAPKTYLAHRDLDEDVANDQFERLYDVSWFWWSCQICFPMAYILSTGAIRNVEPVDAFYSWSCPSPIQMLCQRAHQRSPFQNIDAGGSDSCGARWFLDQQPSLVHEALSDKRLTSVFRPWLIPFLSLRWRCIVVPDILARIPSNTCRDTAFWFQSGYFSYPL